MYLFENYPIWLLIYFNRTEKQDHIPNPTGHEAKTGAFDSFSETQTESQVCEIIIGFHYL